MVRVYVIVNSYHMTRYRTQTYVPLHDFEYRMHRVKSPKAGTAKPRSQVPDDFLQNFKPQV